METDLQRIVSVLAGDIGPRSFREAGALRRAADFITAELESCGYAPVFQDFDVDGIPFRNIIAEKKGVTQPDRVMVLGAHYDTVPGTPGADDNASGVAGMLELARLSAERDFGITVRFVAFAPEEPPFFRSDGMGSFRYARSLKEKGEDVAGMICLEMIGYFTDRPESQLFPSSFMKWMFPDRGNFIVLVSNMASRGFLDEVKQAFRSGTSLPVESLAAPPVVPGVDLSDHWAFQHLGYRALMVTDTAFYRNPHYHLEGDRPETLDYTRMAAVVEGLEAVLGVLAGRR